MHVCHVQVVWDLARSQLKYHGNTLNTFVAGGGCLAFDQQAVLLSVTALMFYFKFKKLRN